jgi:abequosyltransferase
VSAAPLLTFAIPTYNRLDCLRLLLERIGAEVAATQGGATPVEVLVCDNASTDASAAWLAPLAAQGRIRLLRQPSNIGADGNFVSCVREARGRYVWIFGDDDLPLPGAITRVAQFLRAHSPALLYLPARWHEGDLAAVDVPPLPAAEPVPVEAGTLALRANAYVTFISSWVLDRERYFALEGADSAGRYVGTSLVQLEWTLTLLADGGLLCAADTPWVLARAGNTGGYALFETFIARYHRIVGEKLAHRPVLRDLLQQHLLRGYLPGLVWAMRIGKLGRFDGIDWGQVDAMLEDAWPRQPGRRAWVRRIVRWPRPLAKLAMGWCWLEARLWLTAQARRARSAA